jgi:predicted metal-dependent hydrolase
VSPAAIRIPDPRQIEFPIAFPAGQPQIFVHEGARQALERRLSQAQQRPVVVAVTDNRRHMISYSRQDGISQARIHHMFLDAPSRVQQALVRFIVQGDRAASLVVGRYIDDHSHRIRAVRPVSARLYTQGTAHDLLSIFHALNRKYFDGTVDALITWGKRTTVRARSSRRTIKLGSYSAIERLIRIHPVLDRPWVPRYFVSYVIYHEMLHHVLPSSQGGSRGTLHPPIFRARERMFRDFERALAWEKAHVGRLLRS